VVEAAAELRVSAMTIRRDLMELERAGQLIRTHGGALAPAGAGPHAVDREEPAFDARLQRNREAKRRIAGLAATLIGGSRTVALDVGTTTYLLARSIADRPGLAFFTSSLRIAALLGGARNVYVPGGQVRGDEMSICGPTAVGQFERLWFDIAFIGVSGLTAAGIFDYSLEDSELKRVYLRRSSRKVVLCDASKFARMSLVQIAALGELDMLVSDAAPPPQIAAALAAAKVELHIASEGAAP
jgi:DeoR family glycerol-3-phosphate regulon repressor